MVRRCLVPGVRESTRKRIVLPLIELAEKLPAVARTRRFTIALAVVLLLVLVGVRVQFAYQASYPGHADSAFYYTVAENLLDGRGFEVDYIWTYLGNPETITHTSNDYWMPLTAIFVALPQLVLGRSLTAALSLSILASLGIAWVTYHFARSYSESRLVAFWLPMIVLALPNLLE
jgi:hypothetical protein